MGFRFYGLVPENKVDAILEPQFLLSYYLGVSLVESYNMPVAYKKWFIDRISEELSSSSEKASQSKALHANTPELRALQGRQRAVVPARLRRFT